MGTITLGACGACSARCVRRSRRRRCGRGVAQPFDMAVVNPGTDTDFEASTRHTNSLKNLALTVFGHQRFDPFPNQTRRVEIQTRQGPHPLTFEYLRPDGTSTTPA